MQLAARDQLAELGPAAASAAGPILQLIQKAGDESLRNKAQAALLRVTAPRAFPAQVVRQVEEMATLRETATATHELGADSRLSITASVAANGARFLIIQPRSEEATHRH